MQQRQRELGRETEEGVRIGGRRGGSEEPLGSRGRTEGRMEEGGRPECPGYGGGWPLAKALRMPGQAGAQAKSR